MNPPHRQQVGHRATHDPDDILIENGALYIFKIGHGEEVQWCQWPLERLHSCVSEVLCIADGRADVHLAAGGRGLLIILISWHLHYPHHHGA